MGRSRAFVSSAGATSRRAPFSRRSTTARRRRSSTRRARTSRGRRPKSSAMRSFVKGRSSPAPRTSERPRTSTSRARPSRSPRKGYTDCTIRAPFSGVVTEKKISAGAYIRKGRRSAARQDRSPPGRARHPRDRRLRVQVGQRPTLAVAILSRTARSTRPSVTSAPPCVGGAHARRRGHGPEPPACPEAGPFVTARVSLPKSEKTLLVPAAAVVTDSGVWRVFVLGQTRVVERIVSIGDRYGDSLEVRSGVAAGERVIVGPDRRLVDGLEDPARQLIERNKESNPCRHSPGSASGAPSSRRSSSPSWSSGGRLLAPRPRPVPERRLPQRHRDHPPAGRGAGGDGNGDHRQDRGGGQHDRRHRRPPVDLGRGRLAGLRHVRPRQGRQHRRAGGARQGQPRPRGAPERHRAAERREARSRRDAGALRLAFGNAPSARPPRSPTRCCAARSSASTASVRSRSSADETARSTSASTPSASRHTASGRRRPARPPHPEPRAAGRHAQERLEQETVRV